MKIEIDRLKINYTDEGDGAPVVLIHGWGSSILPWEPVLPAFSGYRVIALDLPGCGESDILTEEWDMDDYCDFIIKFLLALKVTDPILCGHSHGGRIILKLVGEGKINPQKIILFDSAGIPAKKTLKKQIKLYSFKTVKTVLTLPGIKNYTEDALKNARNYFGSADYNSAPEVMRKTMVKVLPYDTRPLMPNIVAPTLLIWGENDTATPLSDGKYMESHIKDAGLCVIKDAGHFSFLEKPYQVSAIIKSFLKVEN